jgi:arylformamidase
MRHEDIVELSQRVVKEREFFKLETKLIDVTSIEPDVKHSEDVWYVSSEVTFSTHVGTHIEAPFHHLKTGAKVADLPLHKLFADLVVLDYSHKRDGEGITLAEIQRHDAQIKKGDVVFILTDRDKLYGTKTWQESPFTTEEAIRWLISKQIACFGSDAANMEVQGGAKDQPVHTALFNAGIPMVESLTNLRAASSGGYMVVILPLPIVELDASPVRIIAVRKQALREVV